ncbi:heparinase II/III family protein [Magnetovibrio sp. PR-2]|uniref:heparinase II/III family protein n=1 Tax=Magnetovibrio sp. PR-2 TaxID=3120356 RepID=UPI002FCDE56D
MSSRAQPPQTALSPLASSGFLARLRRGGFQSTALYRFTLRGSTPKGVKFSVPELWPGDPQAGRALLSGAFRFEDEVHTLSADGHMHQNASSHWQAWFHGHSWLKDIRALGGNEANSFVREHMSAWIDTHTDWSPIAWRADVVATRLIQWCQHWSVLAGDPHDALHTHLRQIAGRDARHLMRSTPPKQAGYRRLLAIKGQVFAAFALLGGDGRMSRALRLLEDEINAQVLPDGGHIERSPERLSDVLRDLLELKALLHAATGDVPRFVQNGIDRAAPMLRLLRYPDGGLAVFNGGLEGDPVWLDQLLAHTDSQAKAPVTAPHMGYQKLQAGDVCLMMDCQKPNPVGYLQHAGTSGFELSIAKLRLIVNCGARKGLNDPWRTALAATAAHSCLAVNDSSSSTFHLDGTLKRGPKSIMCDRQDIDQGAFVETAHDGYLDTFGLTHQRAIFIAAHGTDVRGEDRLIGTGGDYFTLRFHLHPDVKASLLGDGQGVMLRLADDNVWRLRTSAQDVKLESSVYAGTLGAQRRSEQIVLTGPLSGNGALIKWAITREGI